MLQRVSGIHQRRLHSGAQSRPIEDGDTPPRVLFVTSEMTDFVKVGGLGDVSAALPRALRQTNDIRVLIPGYRQVVEGRSLREVASLPPVAGMPGCSLAQMEMADGLVIYVLLCPELFDREGTPYANKDGADWADNDLRFARLSMAAAEIAAGIGDLNWTPDLLHINDWPSSLAPAYLKWRGLSVPSLITVHNLAYQGLFPRERLPALAIPEEAFQMEGVEFHGNLSFLKTGIYYASHVTTVSQTYAREITTPEFGCGLEGLLQTRARQNGLTGILNGVDESWDASTDPQLAATFSAKNLSARTANAQQARDAFGLRVSRGPLFAIISRLVHQKGIDLAINAAEDFVQKGGQLAVTGQGDPSLETAMKELAKRHPGMVGVKIGFDEAEARGLFAGSDFLLMPSRFEPCGLSQLYAQRYGSLPVAYRTGGLADTIEDGETGFLFNEMSIGGLMHAIGRALNAYGSRAALTRMRRKAMARPMNWLQSSRRYNTVYSHLLVNA